MGFSFLSLSAQPYYYLQYSHDSMGNRTGRARYTWTRGDDDNHISYTDTALRYNWWQPNEDEDTFENYVLIDTSSARHGCLVRTWAQKEEYRKAVMAEVDALMPISSRRRGVRDVTTYDVGEIPLAYGLSPSGARTYSVPILTAPDLKYAPSLSLVYNSQRGHGYGGYGWDIDGVSEIRLVSRSLYYDGEIRAASVSDTSAVFALDGVRLVRNEDSATSAEYPLVTAQGHIIVAPYRNALGYVRSFQVKYPDGTTASYGTSENVDYQITSFPIERSTNIDGELIVYEYDVDTTDGNYTLTDVYYGFNSTGQPQGNVSFTSTVQTAYGYYAGKKVMRSPRLTKIVSKRSGTSLYTYDLTYESTFGASLLSSISLTNKDGHQLPPLEFTYGQDASPHQGNDSLKIIKHFTLPYLNDRISDELVLRRGKFLQGNYNDGILAYLDCPIYTKSGSIYECSYPANLPIGCIPSVYYDSTAVWTVSGPGFQTAEAVDVDGDGADEVVEVYSGTTSSSGTTFTIKIRKCDDQGHFNLIKTHTVLLEGSIIVGSVYCPYYRTYRWGDFTGRGKAQLLVINYCDNKYDVGQAPFSTLIDLDSGTKMSYQYLFTLPSSEDNKVFCTDIDGDSRTELCYSTSAGLKKYRYEPSGFVLEDTYDILTTSILSSDRTYFSDINADGYLDVLNYYPIGSVWVLYQNTGQEFIPKIFSVFSVNTYDRLFLMDLNRDGYPDMIRVSGTTLGYYLNNDGMSFGSYQQAYASVSDTKGILPANVVDYSSMCSFIKLNNTSIDEYGFTTYTPEMRQLVQSRDSYGKVLRNTYAYLPQSAQDWTDNPTWTDTSGYQLKTLPIYVLKGAKGLLSDSSGSQRYLQETYTWMDGVVNTRGLGFCGFTKTTATNIISTPIVVSVNEFNPRKAGVPVSSSMHIRSAAYQSYSSTSYTYDNHSTTYGKLSPRLTQSLEENRVTGVSRRINFSYDFFDYPEVIDETSWIGVFDSTLNKKRFINYNHSNNTDKYVLGIIYFDTVICERDGNMITHWAERTTYSYDNLFHPIQRLCWTSQNAVDYHIVSKEQWTYDTHGNVLTEKSAPYNSSAFIGNTYTYDSSGRHLVTSTNALGQTTTYSGYNIYGSPTIVTDFRGRTTSLTYDSWGNRTGATHPDGTVESTVTAWSTTPLQYAYEVSQTRTGSPETNVRYDALGREVRSSEKRFDGQWQHVRTYYDVKGRLSYVTMPYRGNGTPAGITYYYYDSYNRPTRVRQASGRETRWSYSGTSVTETSDSISITRTTNAFGDLVGTTDAGGTVTYTLRDDGNPSSVTVTCGFNSTTTTFSYDAYGRKTSINDPSAGLRTTSYAWNSDGTSSVTQTNDKGSITTSYDTYGRVTNITRPGSFNTTYTYDTYGRLVSEASTNSTSEHYTYDAYDRPDTVRQYVPDSKWLQKVYTYGAGSNVSSISYTSQDGYITTENYTYANGHVRQISAINGMPVLNLSSENDLGQPTAATTAGVSRTYGYTQYGMPTFRKLGTNGSIQHFTTDFDPRTGNLRSRGRQASGQTAQTESFSYDALGRLVSTGDGSLTYNTNGNPITKGGVGTMTYSTTGSPYKMDRLYTSFESVTRPNTQTVTYTAFDRPATITEGPPVATFTYDASYDRVKMHTTVYNTTIAEKYYIGGRYEYEENSQGVVTQRLFLGGDAYNAPMVLQKTGNSSWIPYVIGRDYLGSITHIASVSGSLVAEYSYDAWGRMRDPSTFSVYSISSEPSLLLGRGYCGHEHLPMFGLINMNARLYDPVLGRFLSPDPFVQAPDFTQNFNRYSYALNNPLKYTDESGEYWNIIIGAAIGGIGNLISNWSAVQQGGFWMGLGYFAVGAAVGAVSSFVSAGFANYIQAAGVFAGATSGFISGFFTGGTTSLLTTMGNNLLSGKPYNDNLNETFWQGASWGALSGAISGGIQGYRYAKQHGANPWTNRIDEKKYSAKVKTGVEAQTDPTKYCYAHTAEYADAGHGNHKAAEFIEASGNSDGGDFAVLGKVSKGAKNLAYFKTSGLVFKSIDNIGLNIENNVFEVAGTINDESHWVNVIGVHSYDSISWFGGNVSRHEYLRIWNPIGPETKWIDGALVTNIRIFKY